VKYADGPAVEVATFVAASPAAVWALVSDITTPVHFSGELQEARWIDDEHFVGRSRHPAIGAWETTCTVVNRDPEREFGWVVGDPGHPSAAWRFTLEPAGNGTVLRQWMRMGPAPSGLNIAIQARPDKEERIVARRLEEHRANMQTTVDGIRRLAEGNDGPPT
jgi:Polyketide cyclase / dehydrase and lipid transport